MRATSGVVASLKTAKCGVARWASSCGCAVSPPALGTMTFGAETDEEGAQDQLDRSPNGQGQCDYYRVIEKDDPKHVDWRKKLGGMLLRELGGKQHEGEA